MGRIDSLTYDPATKRLFAAKGTGGIWMSTDYGDTWRSVGDGLPSQIVGAVAWSSANGGTLLAVSGDPTFGSGGYTGYGAFYSTEPRQDLEEGEGRSRTGRSASRSRSTRRTRSRSTRPPASVSSAPPTAARTT